MKLDSIPFISYLKDEKKYSPLTVNAYESDLKEFFSFLKKIEIIEIEEIDLAAIRAWQVELSENGNSNRSIARKISSLRSWFRFLKKQGLALENPLNKIILPKQSKKLPSFLQESEMENLFHKIEFPQDFEGMRDKLILKVLYETGIRRAELLNLKELDIDFDRNEIRVLGKRNKERIIPINDTLKENIILYLQEKRRMNFQADFLFITKKDRPMSANLLTNIVKTYLTNVCSLTKKSPHVLRHTFATHLLNNGAEINAIKELLGHSSLAATQVYTHNTIEKLKNTYNNAHPRAKNKGGHI